MPIPDSKRNEKPFDIEKVSIDNVALNKLATMLWFVANTQLGFTDKSKAIEVLERVEIKRLDDETLSVCIQMEDTSSICAYIPRNQWGVESNKQNESFSKQIYDRWLKT